MQPRIFGDLRHYSRLAIGFSKMLRAPMPSDPYEFLRSQLRNREQTFLDMAEKVIFTDPAHPYHAMFRIAGCGFGDLANEVNRHGLEDTLLRLRAEGVYLAHDEWKGRMPIVRAGQEIAGGTESFRNPLVSGWVDVSSSGSSGRAVTTSRSTALQVHYTLYHLLRAREFGVFHRRLVLVKEMLPDPSGFEAVFRANRIGITVDRWFSMGSGEKDWAYRGMSRLLILSANLQGAPRVYPEFLPLNDFLPAARHLARRRREGRPVAVQGNASPLVRVAAAASSTAVTSLERSSYAEARNSRPASAKCFATPAAKPFRPM